MKRLNYRNCNRLFAAGWILMSPAFPLRPSHKVRQPLKDWEKGNRVPWTWSIDAPCVMVKGGICKGWGLPGDSFPNGQGPPPSLLALNGRRWLQTSHVYLYSLTEAKQRPNIPLKDYAHRALGIAHPIHLYLSEDKTGELFKSIKRVRLHWHIRRY